MPAQREGRAKPRWYDTPLIWRGGVAAVKAGARETGIDLERFRLRRFVEELRQTGELEVRTGTAELAEVAAALEGNARAVLFERVGKEGAQLVGNVMGSRARLARAFGVAPDKLLPEVLRRLRTTPQVVEVPREAAPAQEVVLAGDKADLTTLPVNLQHGFDGAPYISASIDFVVDPSNGWTNVGVRRLMLRGRREAGIDINSPSDVRGHIEAEGPYGEFLGYYGAVKQNPVFHLTAITRRRDALFQTATIGGRSMSRTDTAVLTAVRTEVVIWKALEIAVREPVAVYATTASGGNFNVRVALRQRVPGEARNAIAACLSALVNVKNVFVVDPDIDVTSDEQMDWAMATRFQPDRDLVVLSGMRTLPLDPSITGGRVGSKAGFDLTWPFGTGNRLETRVPEPPRFEGRRFASIKAALTDGPKHFEELMTAVGSRDGREIVRELETLRASIALDCDQDGRYVIKPAGK